MAANSPGTKTMLLGLQLTLLGFIVLVTSFWVFSEATSGLLIITGTLLGFSGFAAGRGT